MFIKVVNEKTKASSIFEACNINHMKISSNDVDKYGTDKLPNVIGEMPTKEQDVLFIKYVDPNNKVNENLLVVGECSVYIMSNEARTIEVIRLK